MSAITVQEFLEKVKTDESLAQELIKALEAEDDREAVTELAISKGYDITSEELWVEVQKSQEHFKQGQDGGDLSDKELESVAGGTYAGSGYGSFTAGYSNYNVKW
ncbi:Nif11-like leader peptide family natural product precursor [Pseudanabaena sp. FACHB-1998]|uniref:Nif11-like leader peptide family natural product precursor n=1 Tax=Pseudanabaena sp. FACHB-1998 TaxID=2692858 RepID=UPI001680DA31|nr:Nif11-like leader peptide family natural product precursor [Pseudanabaena sp. FACHB-1998]MBD2179221.1 Nif11-like leader peptide family natural product precursor [Pseudanabaena sp. FACHB-1998]